MRHSMRSPILVLTFMTVIAAVNSAAAQKGGAGAGTSGQPKKVAKLPQAGPEAPVEVQESVPRRNGKGVADVPFVTKQPFPPLEPEHQRYLDDILRYWEKSSSSIQRYKCKFQRWEYDPVFGPRDTHVSYSTGIIQYATPDKGLFKVEKIQHYTPPKAKGEEPKYVTREGEFGEHWVCDGQSVFKFDHDRKQLIESKIPPDMRGQAIVDGPLPFLFGARADKIKARYWIHVITPSDAKGEYWLEAFPKQQSDAANFKKIEVIIDEADFLPKAIQVFLPEYNERTNPVRSVFMFSDRRKNNHILDPLGIFNENFARPKLPKGWEKIVAEPGRDAESPPPAASKGNQAKKPSSRTTTK